MAVWQFAEVRTCPVHSVLLECKCRQCGARLSRHMRWIDDGCRRCGERHPLQSRRVTLSPAERKREQSVLKLVTWCASTSARAIPHSSFDTFATEFSKRSGVSLCAAGRACNVEVLPQGVLPTIRHILNVSTMLDVAPHELLSEPAKHAIISADKVRGAALIHTARPAEHCEKVMQRLLSRTCLLPPITLLRRRYRTIDTRKGADVALVNSYRKEFCRQLRASPRHFREPYVELCLDFLADCPSLELERLTSLLQAEFAVSKDSIVDDVRTALAIVEIEMELVAEQRRAHRRTLTTSRRAASS